MEVAAKEWKPRFRFASTKLLALVVLAGILAGIISTRAHQENPRLAQLLQAAVSGLLGLVLVFCVGVVIVSVKRYKKHGKKSLILGPVGTTALVLGTLLTQLAPDNKTVTGIFYILLFLSSAIAIHGIRSGRREIARLEREAAQKRSVGA
jgi:hypothetical protein